MRDACALVIGGGITGYSVIQDLYGRGLRDIVLFDYYDKPAAFSNKLSAPYTRIGQKAPDLLRSIQELHRHYERIVVFPTADGQVDNIFAIYGDIEPYCFLPLNRDDYLQCCNKYGQYAYCQRANVPYPESVLIESISDLEQLRELAYPIIIKPTIRWDHKGTSVFRNLVFRTDDEVKANRPAIESFLEMGYSFLASEVIPGEAATNLYSYYAYRSPNGGILNEWVSRKLSKYPNDFGVFSTVSNEAPAVVREQGRALIEKMDWVGIATAEFKYDSRDGRYKLMEVNLRNPMSGGLGRCTGVDLAAAQYLDAMGEAVPKQVQMTDKRIHYAYLRQEISNLLRRRGYQRTFTDVLLHSDRTHLAFWDPRDIKPFMVDMGYYIIKLGRQN